MLLRVAHRSWAERAIFLETWAPIGGEFAADTLTPPGPKLDRGHEPQTPAQILYQKSKVWLFNCHRVERIDQQVYQRVPRPSGKLAVG